jgi:predicted transcriptional regulator
MDSILDQPTRRSILSFVVTHPGTSAREIQRSLSLGWGDTVYHLKLLLRESAIQRERAGRRDYFFDSEVRQADRRILVAFQSKVDRAVLLLLTQKPDQSFAEMTDELHMNKSTLSFHLKYLCAARIIGISMIGGVRRYHAERPSKVWELYSRYRDSWGNRWIDRFTAVFGGLLPD